MSLPEAVGHLTKAIDLIQEQRVSADSRIIREILLQMEQRLRLDCAHLGTLIGLKSSATVRTRTVAKKSRGSAKSQGPQRR